MDGFLAMGLTFTIRDNYSNEVSKIQKSFEHLNFVTDNLAAGVNKAMDNLKIGLAAMDLGTKLLSPFGFAINKAKEFEKQMSNVKSTLSSTDIDLYGKKLTDLALLTGKNTAFSAVEAAKGIEELLKAGASSEKILGKNGLEGVLNLATAGEISLTKAAELAATSLNVFSKDGLDFTKIANILSGAALQSATKVSELKFALKQVGVVAASTGFSFEDTNNALAVLAKNGLNGEKAGTGLATMLNRLNPTTKTATEWFQRLGLVQANGKSAFVDTQGNALKMGQIAEKLKIALKGLDNDVMQRALYDMFGQDAIKAATLFAKEGQKGFDIMLQGMQGINAADVAARKLDNFAGSLVKLEGSIETAAILIGTAFLPMLKDITDFLDFAMNGVLTFIETPLTPYLLGTAFSVGVLSVAVGAFVVTTNLATFFAMQASASFAGLGLTSIATAFATKGLTGGLIAVTKALIPLIAKTLLLSLPFVFLYKSFTLFRESLKTGEKLTGFLGFMQKVGSVVWAVGQAFSSFDTKTGSFNLGDMEAQLKKLGVFDLVLRIGEYTLRFIGFIQGLGSGISELFTGVGNVLLQVYNYLSTQVNNFLKFIGLQSATLKQNTATMQQYAQVGKVLGYVIGGVLLGAVVALTWAVGGLALSIAAAMLPFLPFIALVGAVVAVFYYWNDIIKVIGNVFNTTMKGIYNAFIWVYNTIKNFIVNIPTFFYNAFVLIGRIIYTTFFNILPFVLGVFARIGYFAIFELPKLIWQGITNIFGLFVSFGSWLLFEMPKMVGNAFLSAMNFVYNIVNSYINFMLGLWYNLGMYLYENIPIWFANAFKAGYNFLFDTLPKLFSQLGTLIMDSLISGLVAAGQGLKDFFANAAKDVSSYFTSGFNVFGNTENATTTNGINKNDIQTIGNNISKKEAAKSNFYNNFTNNANTMDGQNQNNGFFGNLVIEMDGQQVGKILNDNEKLNNARR